MQTFVLFESASGYALFEHLEMDEIARDTAQLQTQIQDLALLGRTLKLKSVLPFKNAQDALANINDVSEGICTPSLKSFLELNLQGGKKSNLHVGEKNLAGSIRAETGIQCLSTDSTHEIIRSIRTHMSNLLPVAQDKAQLGLGHAYSRAKVKFNVNRSDVMVTQAISMLDLLDKDINTFAMRVREWYSWHFPELVKIVGDNYLYAKLTQLIKHRQSLATEEGIVEKIADLVGEDDAKRIYEAAKISMGTDISEIDMINIQTFAARIQSLVEYKKQLQSYLHDKMEIVAPNLANLVGDVIGARLISHAGSLTNLSKYPASTVQILGAEKALFRALKTRGNTPKYGLLFHSTFIGRAGQKNKGRMSRFLANKCSMASRIDCFGDTRTGKFGDALREQVENRLKFYETGEKVECNVDVMKKVCDELAQEALKDAPMEPVVQEIVKTETVKTEKAKKDKKKRKHEDDTEPSKKKKSKKSKE